MIGILGAGHLGGYLAAGLARAGRRDVILSERGHGPEIARARGFTTAPNAALVEASHVVLLAVRPKDAPAAVADLPWRDTQTLISCCAGVPLAALGTAARKMRAMPISAAAIGASPTTVYPDLPEGREVLNLLGTVIPLASEEHFAAASVAGAVYGWAHALIGATEAWFTAQGLPPETARETAANTFAAAAAMCAHETRPIPEIVASLATPGGITQAGLDTLAQHGTADAWQQACAAALARMRK